MTTGNRRSACAADVADLPPALDLPTAARWLGIGRTTAYELVKTGDFPVPVLRIGTSLRVPTALLLHLLGLKYPASPPAATDEGEPPLDSLDGEAWQEQEETGSGAGFPPVLTPGTGEEPWRTGFRCTARWSVDRRRPADSQP